MWVIRIYQVQIYSKNNLYLDILQLIKPRYEIIDILKYPDKPSEVKLIFYWRWRSNIITQII